MTTQKMTEDEAIAYLRANQTTFFRREAEAIRTVCDALEGARRAVPVAYMWRYNSCGGAVENGMKITESPIAPDWLVNLCPTSGPIPLFAAAPAQPATETAVNEWPKEVMEFTLAEASDLVNHFGGDYNCTISVAWFPDCGTCEETGELMPAGLYSFHADYPDEGRIPLANSPFNLPEGWMNKVAKEAQPDDPVVIGYTETAGDARDAVTEAMLVAALKEADPLGALVDWDESKDCVTRPQMRRILEAAILAKGDAT